MLRLENTPEGRVVSWLLPRYEEQMKMKKKEIEGEINGMRYKPGCQDLQKHLKEGRRDCWNQVQQKSYMKACEDGMKKK